MLPVALEFPRFVADQLLTSDDLNELFGYLDEQNRMTRTNLIGIGIVCGLQLQVNNNKTAVTITRGCGVTSEGYLVAVETNTYTQFKKYDVATPRVYDKFKKSDGSGGKIPMDIWELKKAATDPDTKPIDSAFLSDKVILLFVELKEEENKNCDPASCDDKGISVTVSFLPMAVSVADAAVLMGATTGSFGINTYTALPEVRMRRWDVPNSGAVSSADIFEAYLKILDKPFISAVEATLKNIYTVFGSVVAPDSNSNPFNGLTSKFEFLFNGNISASQTIHLQYYYDLFSDLLLAYQEFRTTGTEVLSTCCPDSSLFPRHIMLGEANPSVSSGLLPFRHYFIYSPLFDKQNTLQALRSLFTRLVLLVEEFFLPTVQGNNSKEDNFLRITPSSLANIALSKKAIPYYYQVNSGTKPLFKYWDHQRTILNDAKRHLSYHAIQYNATDGFVKTPLLYDLEPYNFLRVEGIIGKSYVHVLKQVKTQISNNRLPIDIIALNTSVGLASLRQQVNLNELASGRETGMEMLCHFQDLESMYDSMRKEILCMLCKELRYYYDFIFPLATALFARMKQVNFDGSLSEVNLFDSCNAGYKIKTKSLGVMIEFLYRQGFTDENLTLESLYEALGFEVEDANSDGIPDQLSSQQAAILLAFLNFFKIPLGIIRLADLLTDDLAAFDAKAFCAATDKLAEYAASLKTIFSLFTKSQTAGTSTSSNTVGTDAAGTGANTLNSSSSFLNESSTNNLRALATTGNSFAAIILLLLLIEDLLDHLDKLIYNCKCGALTSLKADYMRRYAILTRLRQFGYFSKMHPGLQHKAGVPMGGTFIIVYHSKPKQTALVLTNNLSRTEAAPARLFTENAGRSSFVSNTQHIAGVVKDEDGETVANAIVTESTTGSSALTNIKGQFKMAVNEVPFTLQVEAAGFLDYEELFKKTSENISIVLSRGDGSVIQELPAGIVIADFYLPYRCCSDCPPIQYIVQDIVEDETPNQGPVADAGPDQTITLPEDSVTLNGSASTDPDGSITFFQWAKLSGPATAAIVTPNSAQTDVKDLAEGSYVFELSVTDDDGAIARDTVVITVKPAPLPDNKPPVADAGEDKTIELNPNTFLVLDGSKSKDEDGSIVTFKWTQLSGPAVTIVSPGLVQTPVSGLQQGVYEFQLTVVDNNGAADKDTVKITVTLPPNKPPVADAGPDQNLVLTATNNLTMLDGSFSKDPEGSALSFKWTFVSGPNQPSIAQPNSAQTMVTGLVAGTYKFQLQVTDDKGASASDTVLLQVSMAQKECGSVASLVNEFSKLSSSLNADQLKLLKAQFKFFDEMQEYFAALKKIQNAAPEKQLEFFATPFAGQDTAALFVKWLSALQKVLLELSAIRPHCLSYFRILLQLSMYIVCIQPEDFDKAKVPMNTVFEMAFRFMTAWKNPIASGAFTADDMKVIKGMANDVKTEITKVEQNNETNSKPNYMTMLKRMLEFLSSIL